MTTPFILLESGDEGWRDDAACAGRPSAMFFPSGRFNRQVRAEALAICATCPVRVECLQLAFNGLSSGAYDLEGIWGGFHFPGKSKQGGGMRGRTIRAAREWLANKLEERA